MAAVTGCILALFAKGSRLPQCGRRPPSNHDTGEVPASMAAASLNEQVSAPRPPVRGRGSGRADYNADANNGAAVACGDGGQHRRCQPPRRGWGARRKLWPPPQRGEDHLPGAPARRPSLTGVSAADADDGLLLLQLVPQPHDDDALRKAAREGHTATVAELVRLGADPNAHSTVR
jgi:hypothetical protein